MKLVTFTTVGAARLAMNWLESVRRLGLDSEAQVYCGDDESQRRIAKFLDVTHNRAMVLRCGVPRVEHFNKAIDWGTKDFALIALAKLSLQWGLSSEEDFEPYLFCDADTLLLANPANALVAQSAIGGIWLQSDAKDDSLPSSQSNLANIGVHLCCEPMQNLFGAAQAWILQRLGELTNQAGGNYFDDQQAMCRALEQTGVRWGILPPAQWRNGQQPWPKPGDGSGVVLLHANWMVGLAAKEQRLRETGFWFVKDEHLAATCEPVALLVAHYHERHFERSIEYETSLRRNLANPYIDTVFVVLEDESNLPPDLERHPKVIPVPLGRRVRYGDFFDAAARELEGRICIVANADIVFDETLQALSDYPLDGKMLCLSRFDNQLPYSQDAWIFRSPLPPMDAGIELGRPSCDNRIAYQAHAAGLTCENPCNVIHAHHVHQSRIRNYDPNQPIDGPRYEVQPIDARPVYVQSPHQRFSAPAVKNQVHSMGFNPMHHVFGVGNPSNWKPSKP